MNFVKSFRVCKFKKFSKPTRYYENMKNLPLFCISVILEYSVWILCMDVTDRKLYKKKIKSILWSDFVFSIGMPIYIIFSFVQFNLAQVSSAYVEHL